MSKLRYIIIFLLFVGSIVSCYGFGSFMKREIGFRGLRDIKCSFDADTKTLNFSFYFLDSFVDIVDYQLKSQRTNGAVIYRLTLIGQHFDKIEDLEAKKNRQIRNVNGRYEVLVNIDSFNVAEDKLFYVCRRKAYPIKVVK